MSSQPKDLVDILIGDPHFVETVLRENSQVDELINEYRKIYPEGLEDIQMAIWILKSQKFNYEDEIEEDFQSIWRSVNPEKTFDLSKQQQITGNGYFRFWTVAASVCVLLGFGVWVYVQNLGKVDQQVASVTTITKSNPEGRKSTITLPDGSMVILNAGSSMTFPSQFGNTREVRLNGEAFFEVVKNTEKPFTVHSGAISTTALGTSFNIRHYPDEPISTVSLATGKVVVESEGSTSSLREVLLPGEQIVARKDQANFEKNNFNYKDVILWKEKIIYFERADWNQIKRKLERWYGVSISDVNPNKEVSYTGQFEDQSLANVLTSIGYSLNFKYDINQDKSVRIVFN